MPIKNAFSEITLDGSIPHKTPAFSNAVVCIKYTFEDETNYIYFDTVNDIEIEESSTMTTHPIVTGDIVADHIYKNPATITMSGSFSINGGIFYGISLVGSKLHNIQNLFKTLKENGVMCTITKVMPNGDDSKNLRFMKRDNMVLTNIRWTEKINSMDYNFTFTQALVASEQTYNVLKEDGIPETTTAPNTNFLDVVVNIDDLMYDLLLTMYQTESAAGRKVYFRLLETKFMQNWSVYVAKTTSISSPSVQSAITAIKDILEVYKKEAFPKPRIISTLKVFVNLIEPFDWNWKYDFDTISENDWKKLQQEFNRFTSFISRAYEMFLLYNSAITMYKLGTNGIQRVILYIDSDEYVFNFSLNNTDNKYYMNVTRNNVDYITSYACSGAINSFDEGTISNAIVADVVNNRYIYLLRDKSTNPRDLRNYYLVVSSIEAQTFAQTLSDYIKNLITR